MNTKSTPEASSATTPDPTPDPIHVPDHLTELIAETMLSPEMSAALSMARTMDPLLKEAGLTATVVAEMLQKQALAAAEGDLGHVRRTLSAQITTLDQMFHHLFRLATVGSNTPEICERFMRMAMRAQTQGARTSHILSRLGQPLRQPKARQEEAVATSTSGRPSVSNPAPRKDQPVKPSARPFPARHGRRHPFSKAGKSLNGLSAPVGG